MIALTQEKREELIEWAKEHIEYLKQDTRSTYAKNCITSLEITLASLATNPSFNVLSDSREEDQYTFGVNECIKDGFYDLYTSPPVPETKLLPKDYFSRLVTLARKRAEKAMLKFPQPNYVLNKVAEENGEVIKAVIHFTEGRETWDNVENELVDNLAMLIRLVTEGDGVIGFNLPEHIKSINGSED